VIATFNYEVAPGRVIFGAGRLSELPEELDRLGIRRALLIVTADQAALADRAAALVGDRACAIYAGAVMHTPLGVTEAALLLLRSASCDVLVALGGGSTIGLSKALALRTDQPQIAVPTTYAGSEMTPILGETVEGRKTTQRSPKVLPETVIYDPDLTMSLPPGLSAVSGMNAMAHAMEALYAREANPIVSLMAEEAIASLGRSLPRIVVEPGNAEARIDALYGGWLCGSCLGAVGMALHHKICHVLGGAYGLPHAETHAVILPHAAAFNADAAPDAMRRVARALGAVDAAQGLFALGRSLRVPASLRALGIPEDGIDLAVRQVGQDAYWNPRPLEPEAIRAMLHRAWRGEAPRPG